MSDGIRPEDVPDALIAAARGPHFQDGEGAIESDVYQRRQLAAVLTEAREMIAKRVEAMCGYVQDPAYRAYQAAAQAVRAWPGDTLEADREFPATWGGGHALVIEFGDEEMYGRCQCGAPLATGTPLTPLDDFSYPWERHVRHVMELPGATGG